MIINIAIDIYFYTLKLDLLFYSINFRVTTVLKCFNCIYIQRIFIIFFIIFKNFLIYTLNACT